MDRKRNFLIYCLIIFSLCGYSQEWQLRKNSVKLDLAQVLAGNVELDYERYFKGGSSIDVSGGYIFTGSIGVWDQHERNGGTLDIQYRRYLLPINSKTSFRFFISPFVRYKYVRYTREGVVWQWINGATVPVTYDAIDEFTSLFFGSTVGLDLIKWNRIVVNAFAGAGMKLNGRVLYPDQYNYLVTNNYRQIINPGYAGILPRVGLRLGLIF